MKKNFWFFIIFWLLITLFIGYMMYFTLYENKQYLFVHAFIYSDFLVHIPLIKSFTYGGNFHPIEYPLFCGEKINYHYGFHLGAAFLEKIGLPFSVSVNILSTLGFLLFLYLVFILTKYLSQNKIAPYIATLLPLFNFSFTWFIYLEKHGKNWLIDLPYLKKYTCFGPWDGCIISAFNNLNIYLNQRHLSMSFGLTLLLIYFTSILLYKSKEIKFKISIILADIVILATLVYVHKGMLLVSLIFLGVYTFIYGIYAFYNWIKDHTKEYLHNFLYLFVVLIMGSGISLLLLELAYSQFTRTSGISSTGFKGIYVHLGFLYQNVKSLRSLPIPKFVKWLIYTFANTGILPFLGIGGFIFAWREKTSGVDRIFNISLFSLSLSIFALANILAFSPDIAVNHKFINFSMIIWEIYSAYFLVKLFRGKWIKKGIVIIIALFLIFNFMIDYVPIFNSYHVLWQKAQYNSTSKWILEHTSPKDKILNLTYSVSPINITGRRIFFGWDYFAFSAGYDTYKRKKEYYSFLNIYKKDPSLARKHLCDVMKKYNLKYIYLKDSKEKFINRNIIGEELVSILFKGIEPLFHEGKIYIYGYDEICQK